MIQVTAAICGECTAKLELATVEQVVGYVRDHADQAERWEIIGTPDEEAAIAKALKWDALAAAARKGGDVQQAPGEAPQSGGDSRNAQKERP